MCRFLNIQSSIYGLQHHNGRCGRDIADIISNPIIPIQSLLIARGILCTLRHRTYLHARHIHVDLHILGHSRHNSHHTQLHAAAPYIILPPGSRLHSHSRTGRHTRRTGGITCRHGARRSRRGHFRWCSLQ